MRSVAARTLGFTTRRSLVHGGLYAAIGISGLVIFFIDAVRDRYFVLPIIEAVVSACSLGLGCWCVIEAVASYRRERGGRNAASQP